MRQPLRVVIGIQARSTSTRFPNKAAAMIGGRSMMEMVLDAVKDAVQFLSRERETLEFQTVLLIPKGDPLSKFYGRVAVIEGDENNEMDVLSRFKKAFFLYRPDYMVRITGDCPMLPSYVITKMIRSAVFGSMDYVSNSHPLYRTSPDGYDTEVMSRRMMVWLFANAKKQADMEHVTTVIRTSPDLPAMMRIGHVIEWLDRSHVKVSVDTPEDLEYVREEYKKVQDKIEKAESYRQNTVIYRL